MRTLQRAARSAIFDRRVHRDLFFDSDATADAVLLVAAISALTYLGLVVRAGLGAFSVTNMFEVIIGGLVGWLILAAGTWLAATKLLQGSGHLRGRVARPGQVGGCGPGRLCPRRPDPIDLSAPLPGAQLHLLTWAWSASTWPTTGPVSTDSPANPACVPCRERSRTLSSRSWAPGSKRPVRAGPTAESMPDIRSSRSRQMMSLTPIVS